MDIDMAGTGFHMDIGRLNEIVTNGLENISRTQNLMNDIGEAFVSSAIMRFETETDVKGNPFIKGHKASGKTLSDSGVLRRSITHNANTSEVIYGSNLEYARIHNEGGIIKATNKKALKFRLNGKWVTKKQVTIPKRQFIGISDDDAIEAREMVRLHIADSFLGR